MTMKDTFSCVEVTPDMQAAFEAFVEENPCSGFHQSLTWAEVCRLDGLGALSLVLLEGETVVAGGIFFNIDDLYLYCPDGPVLDWTRSDAFDVMEVFFKGACQMAGLTSVMFKPRILSGKLDFSKRYAKYTGDLESKFTRMIDLNLSEEELLAQMKGSGRRMLRMAQKAGVQVQIKTDPQSIEAFYRLHIETARRNDFGTKSELLISRLCGLIAQKKQGHLYLAYWGGEVVAGALVVYFGGVATYFFAGSNALAHEHRAVYLLVWSIILDAKKEGMRVFDFGGITLNPHNTWGGFSEFKEKFGGRVVDYEGKYVFQL